MGIIISNSIHLPTQNPNTVTLRITSFHGCYMVIFFFSNHYDILFKLNPILIAILFDYPHDYDHSSFTFSFSHQISFTTQPCATKISPIGPTIGCIFHYSFHSNGDYLWGIIKLFIKCKNVSILNFILRNHWLFTDVPCLIQVQKLAVFLNIPFIQMVIICEDLSNYSPHVKMLL